ncbi:restriction system-associated AAA family ATPase [Mesorhizobium sp. CA7]|uniref:restriction system-associated AAA family ATPase n=1 Tax=Mesorhizobium sp. CA7 TaxID=588501 RepID=UPI001CCCD9FE|nr:restriction system-associated AAA family ATPase [Mesorhizobium sp. CA7]MBZ9816520.1 restriction system-associated AAA family ATPase [Mesorhizobium sp. CA7]
MRLTRVKVIRSGTSGGLLDGLDVRIARPTNANEHLEPLCLLGPNGSGKSQFLQLLAEIFQAAWHAHSPGEERSSANEEAEFELEYTVKPLVSAQPVNVRLSRRSKGRRIGPIILETEAADGWKTIAPSKLAFARHLPSLIIGYTSGDNETLSLPFLFSRSNYASAVAEAARYDTPSPSDNRMLLIDYGTNLEVLFANLVLNSAKARQGILDHARLSDIASCRCVVRLAHPAAPKAPTRISQRTGRKGIQLTDELESILDRLKRSATCWNEDAKTETYTFDFFVNDATRDAFGHFFDTALDLYRALHKFALLNDLAIPRVARQRMEKAVKERRFAARLPEPQQEDLVFGFEEVRFHTKTKARESVVDYASLSDGEHQQASVLGLFSMIRNHNALFVLDEPESHFNPEWRIKFAKRLLDLPGARGEQEVLLTSHAPFVPADLPREQILIFSRNGDKVTVSSPGIETYGANFDRILEFCFAIQPPIAQMARDEINELLKSNDIEELERALPRLGASVEKSFVADHLRQLRKGQTR